MKTFAALGVVAGPVAFSGGPARAQTAQPDFSGTWSLDRSLSTDVSQVSVLPFASAGLAPGSRARVGIGIGGAGRLRGARRGRGMPANDASRLITPRDRNN